MTGSARYAINGIRVGSTTHAAVTGLRLARPIRTGTTAWYITRLGNATAVLATNHGAVQQIGVASHALTTNRAAATRLIDVLR
jgi:hypothetical protein